MMILQMIYMQLEKIMTKEYIYIYIHDLFSIFLSLNLLPLFISNVINVFHFI